MHRPTFSTLLVSAVLWASAGRATVPEVITDIPVVHSLTSMVMGELGTPGLLLEQGADAHNFQLRPSQVSALQGAGLVIWMGAEMTPWLDRALKAGSAMDALALLHTKGTVVRSYEDAEEAHQTDAQDGSEQPAHALPVQHHTDTHDHGEIDPHAWLNPENAGLWLGLISDALSQVDPGNSVTYRANASLALIRIQTASKAVQDRVAAHAGQPIVVAHDAYGYFADYFNLTVAASLAEGDASAPGAAHLSDVLALLEGGQIRCIFPEAGRDPTPVLSLSDGTGVRIGRNLDPEGQQLPAGPDLYPSLLTHMGAAIADCLEDG
ncbi:MAG: zinc ABC transporter substrate-binding protein [Albidovulum sp.]